VRVLHVIGSLIHGGAEALLHRIATRPSEVEHQIVSLGPPAYYSELLERAGVRVDYLNAESAVGGLLAARRLVGIMRESGADVVQCWMYRSNVVAGLCAKAAGLPVVWGIHCSSFSELSMAAKAWVYLGGALAKRVPETIINCSSRSADIHAGIGYDPAVVQVVPNGYDTGVFLPDDARGHRLRAQLGIGPDVFLLGNVSRWHPQKDHRTLVEALRLFKARAPAKWHCLLVGRDVNSRNAELLELLRAADLEREVTCLGERSDVDDIMRALDLHILSSAFGEAFSNVVAEAMASGTPCLVTEVGDSGYLVGETGWVAPPRDPEGLAVLMETAMREWSDADRGTWRDRCEAARHRISANFTLARMVDAYEAIWARAARTRSDERVA
jgi:glycosyltransferase involved in cell wall biosynthesis